MMKRRGRDEVDFDFRYASSCSLGILGLAEGLHLALCLELQLVGILQLRRVPRKKWGETIARRWSIIVIVRFWARSVSFAAELHARLLLLAHVLTVTLLATITFSAHAKKCSIGHQAMD